MHIIKALTFLFTTTTAYLTSPTQNTQNPHLQTSNSQTIQQCIETSQLEQPENQVFSVCRSLDKYIQSETNLIQEVKSNRLRIIELENENAELKKRFQRAEGERVRLLSVEREALKMYYFCGFSILF